MPDYNKLMDDAMQKNINALGSAAQNGKTVDAVANKHTHITKIYTEDKSVDDSKS